MPIPKNPNAWQYDVRQCECLVILNSDCSIMISDYKMIRHFCALTVNRCNISHKGASSKFALVPTLYRELLSRPEWDLFPSLQAGGRRRHWKLSLPEVSTPLTWPRSVTENSFRVGQESVPHFLDQLKRDSLQQTHNQGLCHLFLIVS